MHSASEYRSYLRYFENPRKRQFGEKEGTSSRPQHSVQRTPQRTPHHRVSTKKTRQGTDHCDSPRRKRTETPDPRRFESSPRPLSHRLFAQQQQAPQNRKTTPATASTPAIAARMRIVPDHSTLYRDSIAEEGASESSDSDNIPVDGDNDRVSSDDSGSGDEGDREVTGAVSGDSGVDVNNANDCYVRPNVNRTPAHPQTNETEVKSISFAGHDNPNLDQCDTVDYDDHLSRNTSLASTDSKSSNNGRAFNAVFAEDIVDSKIVSRDYPVREWSSCEENEHIIDQLSENTVNVALTRMTSLQDESNGCSNVNVVDIQEGTNVSIETKIANDPLLRDSVTGYDQKEVTVVEGESGEKLRYTNEPLVENRPGNGSTESDEQRLEKIRKALPLHRRNRRYSSSSSSSAGLVKSNSLQVKLLDSDSSRTSSYTVNQVPKSSRRTKKQRRNDLASRNKDTHASYVSPLAKSSENTIEDTDEKPEKTRLFVREENCDDSIEEPVHMVRGSTAPTITSDLVVESRRRSTSIRRSFTSQSSSSSSASRGAKRLSDPLSPTETQANSGGSVGSLNSSPAGDISNYEKSSDYQGYSSSSSDDENYRTDTRVNHAPKHAPYNGSSPSDTTTSTTSTTADEQDEEDGCLWVRGCADDDVSSQNSRDRCSQTNHQAANTLSTAGSVHSSDEDLGEYDVPSYNSCHGDEQSACIIEDEDEYNIGDQLIKELKSFFNI